MNQIIKKLSEELDSQTRELASHSGVLLLLGASDSVFLNAVATKAKRLGINCEYTYNFKTQSYQGVVVDTETAPKNFKCLVSEDADIDRSCHTGMSAVSQATLALLLAAGLVCRKDITIVGRGHAVKDLAQHLIDDDATVTVAHSKTTSLFKATENRDVVIYATPTITQDISYSTRSLVIDLGNSVPHPDRLSCPYVNRIGQLTTSILLNRFVRRNRCLMMD